MNGILKLDLKKKSSKVLQNLYPLWDFVLLHFLVLLINFILSSFSRLLNTDKPDIAYGSKSHKFMSGWLIPDQMMKAHLVSS